MDRDHHQLDVVEPFHVSLGEHAEVGNHGVVDHVVHGIGDPARIFHPDHGAVILDTEVNRTAIGIGERDDLLLQGGHESPLELHRRCFHKGHGTSSIQRLFSLFYYFSIYFNIAIKIDGKNRDRWNPKTGRRWRRNHAATCKCSLVWDNAAQTPTRRRFRRT